MNTSEELMRHLTALKQEFGLEFQLTDPDATVSVEQRTVNSLFFALLEARAQIARLQSGDAGQVSETQGE